MRIERENERRNEPFRYTFRKPMPGFYNKKFSRHVSGSLQVSDISLNGMRFTSKPNAQLSNKDEVFISFIYNNETISAEGRVIWLNVEDDQMECGVHIFEFPQRFLTTIDKLGTSIDGRIIIG